ncbi:hypothetical protein [Xanthovirga aplysinae]|uniref:hypothetical protein n=1 Tax=Xanthovirga aplysinae TaxID=2529853 RepID=UPI0012BCF6D0|nr:hypothetical protein [Xanthovirga aplysinae]MTI31429.1 hypothetical protein [Xanthovirga aplysinae]
MNLQKKEENRDWNVVFAMKFLISNIIDKNYSEIARDLNEIEGVKTSSVQVKAMTERDKYAVRQLTWMSEKYNINWNWFFRGIGDPLLGDDDEHKKISTALKSYTKKDENTTPREKESPKMVELQEEVKYLKEMLKKHVEMLEIALKGKES